jgi:hypothetical protein
MTFVVRLCRLRRSSRPWSSLKWACSRASLNPNARALRSIGIPGRASTPIWCSTRLCGAGRRWENEPQACGLSADSNGWGRTGLVCGVDAVFLLCEGHSDIQSSFGVEAEGKDTSTQIGTWSLGPLSASESSIPHLLTSPFSHAFRPATK